MSRISLSFLAGLIGAVLVLAVDHWLALPAAPPSAIDVTRFPPRGADDAPRFAAAAATCPAVACALVVPANTVLTLLTPIVIDAGRTLAILGAGHGTSRLTVKHSGTALTVRQNDQCHTTSVVGLRIQGDIASGGPIAGGLAIDYRGSRACAAAPQSVVLEDLEVLAAEDAHAMLKPYPGTFLNGITLLGGPSPAMIGLLRINRINIEPTLTAGPSLPGTSGLALGLVDDIEISNATFSYAQTAIFQTGYMEGLRLAGVTAVGTDHFLTQGPDIIRQNAIFLQKMWLQDFEINTFRAAIQVALVSNSFLGGGEIVRYGNSGKDAWAGIDCTDCTGWMGAANLYFDGLVGNESGSVGMRFRTRERPGGFHSFVGTQFARLGTAVALERDVTASQFVLMQQLDANGRLVARDDDRSGNATNTMTHSQATLRPNPP